MAERNILHIKHLDDFKAWLERWGYTQLPLSQNEYEVLRMHKDKNTVILYRKAYAKEHLSVMEKDMRLVVAFLRSKRGGEPDA